MDKKLGLEHTIRNIMGESFGGGVTTDKYKRTANSFFRNERNYLIERGKVGPDVDAKIKLFTEPPAAPTTPGTTKPVKPVEPAPTEPEVQPNPIQPEIKPKPAEPEVKPETPAAPAKKTEEGPSPDGKIKPRGEATPEATPKAGEGPAPKPGAPKKSSPEEPATPRKNFSGFPVISFPLSVVPVFGPYGGEKPGIYLHSPEERFGESVESDTIRQSIENVARPKKKLDKTSMAKQSELRTKVYEETVKRANIVRKAVAEKKGSNPIVDTNPKLENMELDEKFSYKSLIPTKKGVAAFGAGATLGGLGAMEKSQRAMDSQTQVDQFEAPNPEKSAFAKTLDKWNPLYDPEAAKAGPSGTDYALDALQWAPNPIISGAAGASAVVRDLRRGDYTDAVSDFVGMVPGTKFASWGISKLGGALSKVPGMVSSGKKVAKAGEKLGASRLSNPKVGGYRDTAATVASGLEVGDFGRKIKQTVDQIQGAKESGAWDQLDQQTKNELEPYSTIGGTLKQTGKKYIQDIKKDVVDPLVGNFVSSAGAATPDKKLSGKTDLPQSVAQKMSGKSDLPAPLTNLQQPKKLKPIEVYGGPTSSSPGKKLY
jgi:hypothetical protein